MEKHRTGIVFGPNSAEDALLYQDYTQVIGGPPRVRAFKFTNCGDFDFWLMVSDETGETLDDAFSKARQKALDEIARRLAISERKNSAWLQAKTSP